jgi:hypothetical protein
MNLAPQVSKVADQISQARNPVAGMVSKTSCEAGKLQTEGEHTNCNQVIGSTRHSDDLEVLKQPITSKEQKSGPTNSTQTSLHTVSEDHDELIMLRPQPRSPFDTYEMSDRENSDTDESESGDEDDDEDNEPKKKVSTSSKTTEDS